MNEDMKMKIKTQLKLQKNILYCKHDANNICSECLKNLVGDVSGIYGDVSGIRGDVSDICGDVSDIVEVLHS